MKARAHYPHSVTFADPLTRLHLIDQILSRHAAFFKGLLENLIARDKSETLCLLNISGKVTFKQPPLPGAHPHTGGKLGWKLSLQNHLHKYIYFLLEILDKMQRVTFQELCDALARAEKRSGDGMFSVFYF